MAFLSRLFLSVFTRFFHKQGLYKDVITTDNKKKNGDKTMKFNNEQNTLPIENKGRISEIQKIPTSSVFREKRYLQKKELFTKTQSGKELHNAVYAGLYLDIKMLPPK